METRNTGPGVSIKGGRSRAPVRSPPRHNRTDKNKKDSSVLLVLCRQNEQLFMLEVHMKTDGTEGDRTETRNELLRLAQSSGLKSQLVLPNGTIEGVKGDEPTQILGLTSRSEESLFQELISEEIIHDERGGPSKRRAFSQKDREEEDESSDNSIIEEDEYLLDSSSVLDYEEEEALSFFYSTNSSRPLSVVSSSSTFLTSLSSSSADRGMTPNSRSGSSSMRHAVVVKKTKKKGSSSSARSNRPATAISIMRIPSGGPIQSLLFSPKSRPSTAALHPGSSMTTLDPPGSEEDEEPQPVSPPRKFTSATRRPKAVRFQDPPIPSLPKSEEIPEQIVEQKEPKTVRLSCPICRKRLPLCSQFRCKCGSTFCSVHRYSDRHDCVYDYKAAGASRLTRENPAVSGDKGIVRI